MAVTVCMVFLDELAITMSQESKVAISSWLLFFKRELNYSVSLEAPENAGVNWEPWQMSTEG